MRLQLFQLACLILRGWSCSACYTSWGDWRRGRGWRLCRLQLLSRNLRTLRGQPLRHHLVEVLELLLELLQEILQLASWIICGIGPCWGLCLSVPLALLFTNFEFFRIDTLLREPIVVLDIH